MPDHARKFLLPPNHLTFGSLGRYCCGSRLLTRSFSDITLPLRRVTRTDCKTQRLYSVIQLAQPTPAPGLGPPFGVIKILNLLKG
jgi:hypothetical protein